MPRLAKMGRKRAKTARAESGTQAGASRSIPITLDSDDDEPAGDYVLHTRASESQGAPRGSTRTSILDPNLEQFRYQPQISCQSGGRSSVRPPLSNTNSPSGFFLRRSASSTHLPAPEPRKEHLEYDPVRKKTYKSIYSIPLYLDGVDKQTKNTQGTTATRSRQFSPRRSHVPASRPYTSEKAHPLRSRSLVNSSPATILPRTQQVDIRPKEEKKDEAEMTLLDIDDFYMRTGVAQLMAVAPAIPVRDLYHLIVDSKGQMSEAKKRAIRMTKVSSTPRQDKRPPITQQELESDSDNEIMIKIDPNDPAFEWDTDEPAPEPVATGRARPLKPGSKEPAASGHCSAKDKKSMKSETKGQAGCTAKRTKTTSLNPTHARETSSDREFVVGDNVIDYGLISDDDSGSNGLSNRRLGYGDVNRREGDDAFDLDIDMQPHYAFNADILRKKRRRSSA